MIAVGVGVVSEAGMVVIEVVAEVGMVVIEAAEVLVVETTDLAAETIRLEARVMHLADAAAASAADEVAASEVEEVVASVVEAAVEVEEVDTREMRPRDHLGRLRTTRSVFRRGVVGLIC